MDTEREPEHVGRRGRLVFDDNWFVELQNLSNALTIEGGLRTPGREDPGKIRKLLLMADEVKSVLYPNSGIITEDKSQEPLIPSKSKMEIYDPSKFEPDQIQEAIVKFCLLASNVGELGDTFLKLHMPIAYLYLNLNYSVQEVFAKAQGYQAQNGDITTLLNILNDSMNEHLKDIWDKICESEEVAEYAEVLYGMYICILGKNLTEDFYTNWASTCITALISSSSLDSFNREIASFYPSYDSAGIFKRYIGSDVSLRAIYVHSILRWSKSSEITVRRKGTLEAIIRRLRFSEMMAFKLIDIYLMESRFYLTLYGIIAQRLDPVLEAYKVVREAGHLGPFIKLLSTSNAYPVFTNADFKYVAEISRLIGIALGNATLNKLKIGINIDNPEELMAQISELMRAAGHSIFNWAISESSQIMNPVVNRNFFKKLTVQQKPPAIGTAPARVDL